MPSHPRVRVLLDVLLLTAAAGFLRAAGTEPEPVRHANYKQAFHYSPAFLRQFVYDTVVVPNWIGNTDSFWYSFRTSHGTTYWRVDARQGTKTPLFDHTKLAALLSEATQKPLEARRLPLTRASINSDGTRFKFVVEDTQFEYDLAAEKLVNLGKAAPALAGFPGFGGRGGRRGGLQLQQLQRQQQRRQELLMMQRRDEIQVQQQQRQENQQQQNQQRGGRRGFGMGRGGRETDYRVFSPDRKAYVFVRNHNLYLLEVSGKPIDSVILPILQPNFGGVLAHTWAVTKGVNWAREAKAVQLSFDGGEDYSFGSMAIFGAGMDDGIGRPRVEWAKDSKTFYVTRIDSRGVQDLFLVNALTTPRPTLEKYKYPMPGEDAARKMELFVGDRTARKLTRIRPKFRDEAYSDFHWGKTPDEVRFVRRDRLWRHIELCTANTHTGTTKCLIVEGFENANVTGQSLHYLDETDELIWWSERSGWGHFYLYDRNGKFKNAITTGLFRASQIADVDVKNRLLYFYGNGREPGETVYYEHLYCVHLDGTGLTLMDPGDANHISLLSPTRQFVVDNCSRVDMAPVAILRDATGRQVMKLEEADLSRLVEVGWKMPARFTVKAADGVTDLYGNLWKPFDFDPQKKYPVIVHVYPGPQQEGVTHTFSASNPNQQMAQLGFIVIQVGHRGGAPTRSKAYASYGYFNLRDYGLADKKSAVEQLAARYPFIDIDRVGIYGHSGGGFMSAAAVLQKPYNEFFKAAVASSGNHDNNIYNNGWAERYHGMKEVPVKEATGSKDLQVETGGQRQRGTGRQRVGADADDNSGERTDQGAKKDAKAATRYDIKVPTNAELAENLKGALLLVHGDMDNNVHPANTLRLVDALVKANKRFDMLILPGQRHGYGAAQPYFQQRMWDFFADHLLGDRQTGADIYEKRAAAP